MDTIMDGDIFIAQGDITQLAADAIVYSTDPWISGTGKLHSAFRARFPDFDACLDELWRGPADRKAGDTFWIPLSSDRRPRGVIVVVATGMGTDISARAAVTGAIERAHRELARAVLPGRRLVALPAIR